MEYSFKFNKETKEPFRFDVDTTDLNCTICNAKYEPYNDPFLEIIETESMIQITDELCLGCISKIHECVICKRVFDEPWDKVYFNVSTKEYMCSCCYKDDRNPRYGRCFLGKCEHCKIKIVESYHRYPRKKLRNIIIPE